jgi:hypothetical protein
VESVTVVAAELGVNTVEGGVTVGLGLLDTIREYISAIRFWLGWCDVWWSNAVVRRDCPSEYLSRNLKIITPDKNYSHTSFPPCPLIRLKKGGKV